MSESDLFDGLRAEFCPPLDSSLLAALVADLPALDDLRATLKELASHAHDDLDATFTDDATDFCAETTGSSVTSESSSARSLQSFSSPLGFLQAALPHIPPSRLSRALTDAGARLDGDLDMESVVESLLTNEFVRELEERGLDDDLWKQPLSPNTRTPKKKNPRGKTIALVDIRQRQHIPPPRPTTLPAPDPWTQLASLSEHLATLLPPHPASFFQSHFHSPNYASPAAALRAALSSVAPTKESDSTTTLFTMLDVLRDSPTYTSLDAEQRSSLYADAQLALRATRGRGDDAIDVVWLLLELELDLESGTLAMGVYHVPLSPARPSAWIPPSPSTASFPSSPPPTRDRSGSTSAAKLPSGPPPVQPPPTSKRKSFSSPRTSPTADMLQWQTIPQKPLKGPHPLALHIPAYDPVNQSRRLGKTRGTGNGLGKGGMGDVGELTRPDIKQRMAASLKKRDELLREASKAWRRGNARTRGGDVALYFAERAREFQALAKREALEEARLMVEAKRLASADRSTIDLHGTCIAEAIVIVTEILAEETCSAGTIITGRGTHSANGVGVLKPAVRNALVQDGWNVGVWDGGLVVRGRS